MCIRDSGWSLWGSVGLNNKGVTLFGRYDNTDLSKTFDPSLQDRYYNIGVESVSYPHLDVYKRQVNSSGAVSPEMRAKASNTPVTMPGRALRYSTCMVTFHCGTPNDNAASRICTCLLYTSRCV